MKIAIDIPVYNEEKNIGSLIDSLMGQTMMPDEIVIVNDGSTDRTDDIIRKRAKKNGLIRYICQNNFGRSHARNVAWKKSLADICIFTDGDCIPQPDWIEQMIGGFSDQDVGATAGTYKTANPEFILARFVGYEIAWKYAKIRGAVDFHGAYNLAVRRNILEKIGGFNEKMETAEDADMTYCIAKDHRIIFNPSSVVAHYHPEHFWPYMKSQAQRGKDRVLLYFLHPEKISGDVYAGKIIKYQVFASGLLIPSLILFFPIFKMSFFVPSVILIFLLYSSLVPFMYIAKRDFLCALYGIPLQLARNYSWLVGAFCGLYRLIVEKQASMNSEDKAK